MGVPTNYVSLRSFFRFEIFFTIKFADGSSDLWEFLHSEQASAFLHRIHVNLKKNFYKIQG
ncbi:hypothetical protein LEP1GSC039_0356 [Leptospira santarosai str. 2000027870]|nr:hypothetical protein LEP1GSC039_0356 [Leptospira santarosai str. 2000027870]